MKAESHQELVQDVIAGRMSRREFVIKALALGMSFSGINAVVAGIAVPAGAQVSGGTYTLMVSSSSNRSNPALLASKSVAGKIYVFTTPDIGVDRVRFYLDDSTMSGTPRKLEGNAPFDFAGGTVSTANPFDTTSVPDGSHTITAAVVLTTGGTDVVHAAFTVANNSGTPGTPDQVHLAWVGAPSTTLTVVWRTLNAGTPSKVQYRILNSTAWLEAT